MKESVSELFKSYEIVCLLKDGISPSDVATRTGASAQRICYWRHALDMPMMQRGRPVGITNSGDSWNTNERNALIRRLADQGKTYSSIAKEIGITRQRVEQIVHPDKHRIRARTNYLITSGKLQRPTHCSKCNRATPTDAHHISYWDPRNIDWLCKTCHKKMHRRNPK